MSIRERWHACTQIPAVRTSLVVLGFMLMIVSPAAGILPGPGGIFVFGAGLALALKYSEWVKRKYVTFKRAHPKKGAWADWGLRRQSALRRQARDKELAAAAVAAETAGDGPVEGHVQVEFASIMIQRGVADSAQAPAARDRTRRND
ncbi:hypothetical protein [Sphingosinicella sp. BN140058]|uniref:hypothetical protein n=1 Tax=Sphingosinicella sp. BN140058 TaxID=1892855 RepID=UPI0019822E85|nr:hypothetical protein [Sphingosinicella sp. BN140058]